MFMYERHFIGKLPKLFPCVLPEDCVPVGRLGLRKIGVIVRDLRVPDRAQMLSPALRLNAMSR